MGFLTHLETTRPSDNGNECSYIWVNLDCMNCHLRQSTLIGNAVWIELFPLKATWALAVTSVREGACSTTGKVWCRVSKHNLKLLTGNCKDFQESKPWCKASFSESSVLSAGREALSRAVSEQKDNNSSEHPDISRAAQVLLPWQSKKHKYKSWTSIYHILTCREIERA